MKDTAQITMATPFVTLAATQRLVVGMVWTVQLTLQLKWCQVL